LGFNENTKVEDAMEHINKEQILASLKKFQQMYEKEGFLIYGLFGSYEFGTATDKSDIDVLVETTPRFVELNGGGFGAIARIQEIRKALESEFGTNVDLTDKSGLGRTGQEFIVEKTLYV
jgi:uncharacterized protein